HHHAQQPQRDLTPPVRGERATPPVPGVLRDQVRLDSLGMLAENVENGVRDRLDDVVAVAGHPFVGRTFCIVSCASLRTPTYSSMSPVASPPASTNASYCSPSRMRAPAWSPRPCASLSAWFISSGANTGCGKLNTFPSPTSNSTRSSVTFSASAYCRLTASSR